MRGRNDYRFSEACRRIGISQNTYRRYVEKGFIEDVGRDGRGWRIFTEEDIKERIKVLIDRGLILEQALPEPEKKSGSS